MLIKFINCKAIAQIILGSLINSIINVYKLEHSGIVRMLIRIKKYCLKKINE